MMGVINITPNSFSDGGKFTTTDKIRKQINYFRSYGCSVFDFGAESTAPFNSAVSARDELERLIPLFDLIRGGEFKESEVLSFDTYKTSTFGEILKLTKSCGVSNKIIFNDVSGSLDDELFSLMEEFDFDYVFSHNLAPTRSETSNHMDYNQEVIDLKNYFENAVSEFSKRGFVDRVIFDPCFGFSKSTEQNLELIQNTFDWLNPNFPWVLGVSKKSFLRSLCPVEDDLEKLEFSELVHVQVLVNWFREYEKMNLAPKKSIFIRLHDPKIFYASKLMK